MSDERLFWCSKTSSGKALTGFYAAPQLARMYAGQSREILQVSVKIVEHLPTDYEDNLSGNDYFAWPTSEGKLNYIWKSLIQVKMCSADYFGSAIERGDGHFVRVQVTPVPTIGQDDEQISDSTPTP